MTLDNPTTLEKVIAFITNYKRFIVIAGLFLVLVGSALYLEKCGKQWEANRSIKKTQQVIANNVDTIKNANGEIANLESKKIEATANVNAAVKDLQEATYGLDNAKAETNQALANLNQAVNANANIDATAQDVLKALEKLNQ